MILEIDPSLLDPSPLADRFRDQDDSSFDALKQSISQRGQEVPIIVREHPEVKGGLPERLWSSPRPRYAGIGDSRQSDRAIAIR
ncbi:MULTISPECIES: ParB N-terminal domain-containing protein [Bradyrhizobium]|uniref:ParB N-terminal domain-containing protein n=1 Tax=Bradyrhizobium TaxID=374 RepID=UPI0027B9DAA2|nr:MULTISPECIES: ParB N-terminal domain-containing protein [Bradyrhizobium]